MLLILDLDETLIHATERRLAGPPDFVFDRFNIYRRPHLAEFLAFCAAHFSVAVWTSSSEPYAEAVVEEVFGEHYPLEFLWARKRCTPRFDAETKTDSWLKDLKKVRRRGYNLDRVLVVDDTPGKHARNYGNLVRVEPFHGEADDRELPSLMPYLLGLATAHNVRAVDKRGWRNRLHDARP